MINLFGGASRRRGVNLTKITRSAIIVNAVQVVAALAMALYAVFSGSFHLSPVWEKVLVCLMALVVIWGAFLDIREAYSARENARTRRMLEDTNRQLEDLNGQLRAQRHDFMNHIQVIYSLTEMEDRASALEYMDTVYQDLQKVSRVLKTACPALNALISAKMVSCEEKGISFVTDIRSGWKACPVPPWEMCRVLGNLIDNAMEALEEAEEKRIALSLWEDVKSFHFRVANTGKPIPESLRTRVFETGFSTKKEGRGMGLFIVKDILRRCGGTIELENDSVLTQFHGVIPRSTGESPICENN